jgi:hypothetical protein
MPTCQRFDPSAPKPAAVACTHGPEHECWYMQRLLPRYDIDGTPVPTVAIGLQAESECPVDERKCQQLLPELEYDPRTFQKALCLRGATPENLVARLAVELFQVECGGVKDPCKIDGMEEVLRFLVPPSKTT